MYAMLIGAIPIVLNMVPYAYNAKRVYAFSLCKVHVYALKGPWFFSQTRSFHSLKFYTRAQFYYIVLTVRKSVLCV